MRAAFSRPQDLLLLALMLIIGVAYLLNAEPLRRQEAWPRAAILAALAPLAVGFTWERLVRDRLSYFAEETPLAAEALDQRSRLTYRLVAHLPVLAIVALPYVALIGLLLGQMFQALALGVLSYIAGILMGSLMGRRGLDGRHSAKAAEPSSAVSAGPGLATLFRLVLRAQMAPLKHSIPAAAALVAGCSATAFLAARLMQPDRVAAATGLALFPTFLLMLASSRVEYSTMRILPFAGYSPAAVAASVGIFPALLAAAVALGALAAAATASAPIAAGALLILALHLLIALPRCWLYPEFSRRAADLQVQFELAALLLLVFLLPPLAAIAALGRLIMLYRAHGRLRWQHP